MRMLTSFLIGIASLAPTWPGFQHVHAASVAAAASAAPVASTTVAATGKPIYLSLDLDMNGLMYRKIRSEGKVWYDPTVFAYLEQRKVPATFFVSGLFAVAYPELIQNLASSSQFAFENHSYDESSFIPHCYWLRTLTTDKEKIRQVEDTEQILKKDTGQTATLFRFPGACTNAQNDALIRSLGYTVNDGTDISGDPFNKDTSAIVRAVLAQAAPGATILMHVGGPNAPRSLAVLEQVVPKLEAQGYRFEKL